MLPDESYLTAWLGTRGVAKRARVAAERFLRGVLEERQAALPPETAILEVLARIQGIATRLTGSRHEQVDKTGCCVG
jgi:hypothetical protein